MQAKNKFISPKLIVVVSLLFLLAVNISNLTKCINYTFYETKLLGIHSTWGFYFIFFWSSTLYFGIGVLTLIVLLLKRQRKISFFLIAIYLSNEIFTKFFLLKMDVITFLKFIIFTVMLILYFNSGFLAQTQYSTRARLLTFIGMTILNVVFFYTV